MTENHELSQRERLIQEYLQERHPTLYHELFLSGELMMYLKNKEELMVNKEQQPFQELLQEKEVQLSPDLIQRTREMNHLKQQALDLIMNEFLPV